VSNGYSVYFFLKPIACTHVLCDSSVNKHLCTGNLAMHAAVTAIVLIVMFFSSPGKLPDNLETFRTLKNSVER
jgi:hypothetical protein